MKDWCFMKDAHFGKKPFSLSEIYQIIYKAVDSKKYFDKARKEKLVSPQLQERLMLAVTEVNGCPVCSYAHAKWALEAGMKKEEVENLLSGDLKDTPEDELSAVLFAQHYAETRGAADKSTWGLLIEEYGEVKAMGILAAIKIIMVGNALGIPYSSFTDRFKGKSDSGLSLGYEISVLLLMIPMFLIAVLLHLFKIGPKDSFM